MGEFEPTPIAVIAILAVAGVFAISLIQGMYVATDREETQRVCIEKGGSYNDHTCFLQ